MTVEPLMGLLWAYFVRDVIPEQQRWPEYTWLHLLICDILCSQFHPNKAGHTLPYQQALGHHRAKTLSQPLKNAFIRGEKKEPGRWRGSWNKRQSWSKITGCRRDSPQEMQRRHGGASTPQKPAEIRCPDLPPSRSILRDISPISNRLWIITKSTV